MNSEKNESRSVLRRKLEDLVWWLEKGNAAGYGNAYEPDPILLEIRVAGNEVQSAAQQLFAEDYASDFDDELRQVERILDELKILGLSSDCPPPSRPIRELLRFIPEELRMDIAGTALGIKRDQERNATSERARNEVQRAIENGVFLDYVRRHPGKGALKVWPAFRTDEQYDHIEGYLQSWTECEVFEYPCSRWVIGKTAHHVEADHVPSWTDYEEVSAAQGASILLASEVPLSVDELILLRSTVGPDAEAKAATKPAVDWNRALGELKVNGTVARRVAQPNRAKQVVAVLDVFQEEAWPARIDSPFPPDESGKQTLREAVRSLNKGMNCIRFEADGTGEGIRFRLVEELESVEQSQDFGF